MVEKVLVAGAGRMGSWLAETLCLDYEVGVYDTDREKLKYLYNTHRFMKMEEVKAFNPDLVINATGLKDTVKAFNSIIPFLDQGTIISDIASVKNGLAKFYIECGMKFVSTHPMFGPTFGNVRDLAGHNAIIIKESDPEGNRFFRDFYNRLKLSIFDYSFEEHDRVIAYSLSVPFSSTIVFSACMDRLEVPGTTFRRHLDIARGLLSEDNYLLSGILLNPWSAGKLHQIMDKLKELIGMIEAGDEEALHELFSSLRSNMGKVDTPL